MKNYYQILEVPTNASQDAIKDQYRFLAHAWHPDKFPNPTQKIKAEEKIKEINEAYTVLDDPTKRAEYDNRFLSFYAHQLRENTTQQEEQSAQRRTEDTQDKREESHTPPAITNGEVIRAWRQISSSLLNESLRTSALLNSVKMIELQGSTLVLSFASEVVRSKMKTEEIERTRKAIYEVLGVRLEVRCVVMPQSSVR